MEQESVVTIGWLACALTLGVQFRMLLRGAPDRQLRVALTTSAGRVEEVELGELQRAYFRRAPEAPWELLSSENPCEAGEVLITAEWGAAGHRRWPARVLRGVTQVSRAELRAI